jgi:hypothetical protein
MSKALVSVCAELDRRVLRRDYLRQLEYQRKGMLVSQTYAGSVGVIMVVYKEDESIGGLDPREGPRPELHGLRLGLQLR